MRRGMTLSAWIWIVGGLVVASLLLLVTFQTLVTSSEAASRQKIVGEFNSLTNDVKYVCSQGPGTLRTHSISLSGVRAVYAASSKTDPSDRAPFLIAEQRTSAGDYLCLKFSSPPTRRCKKISCQVNATYMGRPIEGSDMYILGSEDDEFSFETELEKKSSGAVRLSADHVP